MGITTDNFFENIYRVIFCPRKFFEDKEINISVRLAMATLVLVTTIYIFSSAIYDRSLYSLSFILPFFLKITGILIIWLLTGLFFEYIAKIYNKDGKLREVLFFTAFAPIPYVFFAPLNLLKNIGGIGYFFGAGLELLLYLWIIILYVFALRAVYNITLSRSFMLILLPFVAAFFAVSWMMCFISKIWYIFSI